MKGVEQMTLTYRKLVADNRISVTDIQHEIVYMQHVSIEHSKEQQVCFLVCIHIILSELIPPTKIHISIYQLHTPIQAI